MSPAEALDGEAIRAACAGGLIGHRVVVLDEVTSTNDVVAWMAREAAEGFVVFAEKQTAGRGQYGRRWESAVGKGLWVSVLLRPQISVAESSRLTDLLARTIAATVEETTGAAPRIKPPNDVYIGNRKVAGVLVEMRVEASGSYCAVAGMGINVTHAAADFPPELRETAVSLAIAAGRPVERGRFAIALLRELDRRYAAFRALNS
jgi:BirA family biotin operon repressor/biotin-[acetyl-CoA-carboxylase] ligase